MLLPDGAYVVHGEDPPVFRPLPEPGAKDLQEILERIAARIGKALQRRGVVERDIEKDETQVQLYDRLFRVPNPGKRTGNYLDDVNPSAKSSVRAYLEESLKDVEPEARFQFERHGYFVADLKASAPGAPVFNRSVTLRDSWGSNPK